MSAHLVVSVRRPPGAPHVYRFDADEIPVGRAAGAAIRLPHPAVSGDHLRFVRAGDGYAALDAGSRHGTRLGAALLVADEPAVVRTGDVLTIGPYRLEVVLDPRGGATTTDEADTARLAHALAEEATAEADGYLLLMEHGEDPGLRLPLPEGEAVTLGASPDASLTLPGAELQVRIRRQGRVLRAQVCDGPVRVRGEPATGDVDVQLGDPIEVGGALLRFQGPPAPPRRPWSAFEASALVLSLLGLAVAGWLLLG